MRNLKKVLSTIMAVAMMMSVVVFNTSAAFTDQDKIVNDDAVSMNVSLGIINGLPDGTFNPTGNVTRAEMAKMICLVLNGGTAPSVSAKAGAATFTDIRGHWAEGYIEYCAALGIVAGMGDGTFAPNANVTGTQAAKMLLVALGYDAAFEGFNGNNWNVKINVAASQKSLYEDTVLASVNAPLSRDNAAQMVWNALQADMVYYDYSLTTVNGQLMNIQKLADYGYSMMEKKFKATTSSDDDAINYVVMTGYTWDDDNDKFVYDFGVDKTTAAGFESTFTASSTTDYTGLFGMQVNVVFKYKGDTAVVTTAGVDKLYGVYAEDAVVLYTGVVSDIENYDDTYIKVDGTKYKVDGTAALASITAYPENNYFYDTNVAAGVQSETLNNVDPAYTVKVIDQDGNGKVDCVTYLPFEAAEVTYVGSKSITLTSNTITTTPKFDTDTIYTGVAKNDYVKVIDSANTAYDGDQIVKMDSVKGNINAIKDPAGVASDKIQINGTWYTLVAPLAVGDFNLNDEYTVYVVGSYAYYADEGANTTVNDIAFVYSTRNDAFNGDEAKLYYADGTSAVVALDDIKAADGTTTIAYTAIAGKLVTFEKDGSEYDVTLVGATNKAGFDNYYDATGDYVNAGAPGPNDAAITAATSTKAGKFSYTVAGPTTTTYAIADDAVVFIKDGDGDMKVVTGKVANSYKTAVAAIDTNGTVVSSVLTDTTNGVKTVKVGMIMAAANSLPNSRGSADNYAVVMSGVSSVKIDGTNYKSYDIWNGTNTVTVFEEVSSTVAAEGAIIQYTDLGDKYIDDVVLVSGLAGTKGFFAVDGYSGNDLNLVAESADYKLTATTTTSGDYTLATNGGKGFVITDDTVILYVNTEDDEGFADGAIQIAKENTAVNDNGTAGDTSDDYNEYYYNTNVYVFDEATTDGEVDLLVVEVSNAWN